MKRRSFLQGIVAAVTLRALPLPKVRGVLTGDVAVPKLRHFHLAGIRERRHTSTWDTLVRVGGEASGGALAYARSKLKRKDR